MPNLTLRGMPQDLHERLKAAARRNRRSVNSEIILRLETSLTVSAVDAEGILASAREVRGRIRLPYLTDEDMRRDRETGRP